MTAGTTTDPTTQPDHVFDLDAIGRRGDPVEFAVTPEAAMAYAKATNDPIAQHLDGTYAPPVYAVVPPFTTMAATTMAVVPDELMMKILHGEHDMRFYRPIVPGETVTCTARVVGVHGRSSGVVVTTITETTAADGELINEQYFAGFFRGGRLALGQGEPAPAHGFDARLRERPADAEIVQHFDADQTFRYSEASGDPMPIHLDDEFARAMGLPGIIIHGLCTMAFTSHAVIGHACPDNPERLKRLAVRFSAPSLPDHAITTSIWDSGGALGVRTFAFETVMDDGAVVIRDGVAEISA